MALFSMRDSWNVWRRKVNAALGGLSEPVKAEDVTYDNTDSGLTATDVQSAVDEVAGAVDTIEDNLSKENISYTTGEFIDNNDRTKVTKIGNVVVCNIAARLTAAKGNGTTVLTISDTSVLPAYDVFGTGISGGVAFTFKLTAETATIKIEQLANDTITIPQNSGIFGNIAWVVK